jgi:transposase-like protein
MEEEYVTIAEAARRLGTISDKTIRRAIHDGKLAARYPQPNKAEVLMTDLQAWFDSLRIRPGETQDKLAALESRVATLEREVQELHRQLEASPIAKRALPKIDTEPPEGFIWLSDFCYLHHIPYQAALDLFPHAIHGQRIGPKRRNYPAIGPKGQRDFYVQLHTRDDFVTCDDCPHEEHGQGV